MSEPADIQIDTTELGGGGARGLQSPWLSRAKQYFGQSLFGGQQPATSVKKIFLHLLIKCPKSVFC